MRDVEGYLDITPGDFKVLYRLAYQHALERLAHSVKAEDVMTARVFAVNRETPLREVVELMAAHNISGVPVVEDDGRVVGVISEKDILLRMGPKDARSFMDVVAHCLRSKGCVAVTLRGQKAEEVMTAPTPG